MSQPSFIAIDAIKISQIYKCEPHGGTRVKVKGSPKSMDFHPPGIINVYMVDLQINFPSPKTMSLPWLKIDISKDKFLSGLSCICFCALVFSDYLIDIVCQDYNCMALC